ncbi:MAG: porin family protein [Saprospiraceae bacterium]|nr:porin family protein [Saprospiraceae bacterium]
MKSFRKKILGCFTLCTLLLSISLPSTAQSVEFGLRFMPAFTKFDINTSNGNRVTGDVDLGYGVGALLGFHFSKNVGIQGELIYSSFAQKFKESNVDRNINLSYINIPLLLALNTGKGKAINLGLVAGPQIGLNVGSKLLSSNGGVGDPILSVKKGDLGFAYGAGLDFGLNPSHNFILGIGFRGVYGLIDISDQSSTIQGDAYYILDRTKIKVYSGYIGLSWFF